jgi:exonuclease VII large subunit
MATVLRGYAIVRDHQGQVVRSINQVDKGDLLSARLRDGDLQLAVTGKSSRP